MLVSRLGVSIATLALTSLSASVARADLFCYAVKGSVPSGTVNPYTNASEKSDPYTKGSPKKNVLVIGEGSPVATPASTSASTTATITSTSWFQQAVSSVGSWFSSGSAPVVTTTSVSTSSSSVDKAATSTPADVSIVVSLESTAKQTTIAYFRISTQENDVAFRNTIRNEALDIDGRVKSPNAGLAAGLVGRCLGVRDVMPALKYGGARYNPNAGDDEYQGDFTFAEKPYNPNDLYEQPKEKPFAYPTNAVKDSTYGVGFTQNRSVSRVTYSLGYFEPVDEANRPLNDDRSLYLAYSKKYGITGRILIKPGQRYVTIPLLINGDNILDEFEGELIHFQLLATPDRNGDTIIDTTANGYTGEREFNEQANNVVIQINDDDVVTPTVRANVSPTPAPIPAKGSIPVEGTLFNGSNSETTVTPEPTSTVAPGPRATPQATPIPLIVREKNDRIGAEYQNDNIQPNFAFVGMQIVSPKDPQKSYSLIERPYGVSFADESAGDTDHSARRSSSEPDPRLNGYPQFLQDYRPFDLDSRNQQVMPYDNSTSVYSHQDVRIKKQQALGIIVLQGDARVENDDLFNGVASLNGLFFPDERGARRYVQSFKIQNDDQAKLKATSDAPSNINEGDSVSGQTFTSKFKLEPIVGGSANDTVVTEIPIYLKVELGPDPSVPDSNDLSIGNATIGDVGARAAGIKGNSQADVSLGSTFRFGFTTTDQDEKQVTFTCFGDKTVDAHTQEKFQFKIIETNKAGKADGPKLITTIEPQPNYTYTIKDNDVAKFTVGSVTGREGDKPVVVISSDSRVERTFGYTAAVVQLKDNNDPPPATIGTLNNDVSLISSGTLSTSQVGSFTGGVAGKFQISLLPDNRFEGTEAFGITAVAAADTQTAPAQFAKYEPTLLDKDNNAVNARGIISLGSSTSPTPNPTPNVTPIPSGSLAVSLNPLRNKSVIEGSNGSATPKTVASLTFSNPNEIPFSFLFNTATQDVGSADDLLPAAAVSGSGGRVQADDYQPAPVFSTPGITATLFASPSTYRVSVAKGAITRVNQSVEVKLNIFADVYQDKFDSEKIRLEIRADAQTDNPVALNPSIQTAEAFIEDDDTPNVNVDFPAGTNKDTAFKLTESTVRQQVTLGLSTPIASERDLTATFTVSPIGGTKLADFETQPTLLVTLPANQKLTATNTRAVIHVKNDNFQDTAESENFTVSAAPLSDSSAGKFRLSTTTFPGTIQDDDKVVISLRTPSAPVSETIGIVKPAVVRSIGSERVLKVRVSTIDGTAISVAKNGYVQDYVPVTEDVTFVASPTAQASQTINVNIINDLRQDQRDVENFTVKLAVVTAGYTIAQPTSLVEIQDDEQIVLDLPGPIALNESSAATPANILVRARLKVGSAPSDGVVTERNLRLNLRAVKIERPASGVTAARDREGSAPSNYVKDFEPIDSKPAKIIGVLTAAGAQVAQATVKIIDDPVLDEADVETFNIEAPTPAANSIDPLVDYTLGISKTVVTITDNDTPVLSLKAASTRPILEGAKTSFIALLGGVARTERDLQITLAGRTVADEASFPADFTIDPAVQPSAASAVRTLSAFSSNLTFSITANDDVVLDSKDIETFAVYLQDVPQQNRKNALRYTINSAAGEARGKIEDDNIAVLNLAAVPNVFEVSEGASNRTASYQFQLVTSGSSNTGKKLARTIERNLSIGVRLNVVTQAARTTPGQASVLDFDNGLALSSNVTKLTMFARQTSTRGKFNVTVKNDTVLDTALFENFSVVASDVGNTEADDYEFKTASVAGRIKDTDIAKLKIVSMKTDGTPVTTLNEGEVANVKVALDTSAGVNVIERDLRPKLTTLEDTAKDDIDFNVIDSVLTIGALTTETVAPFPRVVTVNDRVLESQEALSLKVASLPGVFVGASAPINIVDNEKLYLSLVRDPASTNNLEGAEQKFVVAIDKSVAGDNVAEATEININANYNVLVDGSYTASLGDFGTTLPSGNVTITPGQTNTNFGVTPRIDNLQDSLEVESFGVKVHSAQASNTSDPLVASSIQDEADDKPTFTVKRVVGTDDEILESANAAARAVKYHIVLDGSVDTERVLKINVQNNAPGGNGLASAPDFENDALLTQTITYDPSEAIADRATFTISVKDDTILENDEVFSMQVSVPTPADEPDAEKKDYVLTGAILPQTIVDNEKLFLQLVRDSGTGPIAEGSQVTYHLVTTAGSATETSKPLTINVAVAPGSTQPASANDFNGNVYPTQTVTVNAGATTAAGTTLSPDLVFTARADQQQDSFEVENFTITPQPTDSTVIAPTPINGSIQDAATDQPSLQLIRVDSNGNPVASNPAIASGGMAYYKVVPQGAITTERTLKVVISIDFADARTETDASDFTPPTTSGTVNVGTVFAVTTTASAGSSGAEDFVVKATVPATGATAEQTDYTFSTDEVLSTVGVDKLFLVLERVSGTGPIAEGSGATYRLVTGAGSPNTASDDITINVTVGPGSTSPVTAGDFDGSAYPTRQITVAEGANTSPGTVLISNFDVNARDDNTQDSFEVENFAITAAPIAADSALSDTATLNGSIQDAAVDQPSLQMIRVDSNGNPIASNTALVAGGTAYYKVVAQGPVSTERALKVVMYIDLADARTEATAADFTTPTTSGTVTIGTIFAVTTSASAGTTSANGEDFVVKANVPATGATAEQTDYTFSTDEVLSTITPASNAPRPSSAPKPSGGNS